MENWGRQESEVLFRLLIGHLLGLPAVLSAMEDRYKDEPHRVSVPALPFPQEGLRPTSALGQQFTRSTSTRKTLARGRRKTKKSWLASDKFNEEWSHSSIHTIYPNAHNGFTRWHLADGRGESPRQPEEQKVLYHAQHIKTQCRAVWILTVLFVHQNFKGIHLIVLKGLPHLFNRIFISQLPIHKTANEQKSSS